MRQFNSTIGPPPSRMRQRVQDFFQFPHVVDIYKPIAFSVGVNNLAKDIKYFKAVASQKCKLIATPEVDVPTSATRSKEVNIFTLDVFYFPTGLTVQDTWMLNLTSAGDYNLAWWVIQGNPQGQEQMPLNLWSIQRIYAKLSVAPILV